MFPSKVEVGDDVFLQPFARRQAVVIEVGDDIFQIAHHVLKRRTDELFLGAEVVAHGSDIDAGRLGDGADGGFLKPCCCRMWTVVSIIFSRTRSPLPVNFLIIVWFPF